MGELEMRVYQIYLNRHRERLVNSRNGKKSYIRRKINAELKPFLAEITKSSKGIRDTQDEKDDEKVSPPSSPRGRARGGVSRSRQQRREAQLAHVRKIKKRNTRRSNLRDHLVAIRAKTAPKKGLLKSAMDLVTAPFRRVMNGELKGSCKGASNACASFGRRRLPVMERLLKEIEAARAKDN